MTTRIDDLSRRRRLQLLAMTAGFLLWQVPQLDMLRDQAFSPAWVVSTIGVVGACVWGAAMVWTYGLFGRFRDKLSAEELAALNDELVATIRSRAFAVGYGATLFTCAVLLLAAGPLSITGHDVALVTLVVGTCSTFVAFVSIERRYG